MHELFFCSNPLQRNEIWRFRQLEFTAQLRVRRLEIWSRRHLRFVSAAVSFLTFEFFEGTQDDFEENPEKRSRRTFSNVA
jgi:hypothetical protein